MPIIEISITDELYNALRVIYKESQKHELNIWKSFDDMCGFLFSVGLDTFAQTTEAAAQVQKQAQKGDVMQVGSQAQIS